MKKIEYKIFDKQRNCIKTVQFMRKKRDYHISREIAQTIYNGGFVINDLDNTFTYLVYYKGCKRYYMRLHKPKYNTKHYILT